MTVQEEGAEAPQTHAQDAWMYQTAFDHAPIGMALMALDGRILKVNAAFCRVSGYEEADLLATTFRELTLPEDLAADVERHGKLVAGEISAIDVDKRYLSHGDGAERWARLSVSLVRDAQGRPSHMIAQLQDITERRRTEAKLADSQARYKLMAKNITDIIVVTDWSGRIRFVTPSCKTITGRAVEDLIGKEAFSDTDPAARAALLAAYARLAAGGPSVRTRWPMRHRTEDRWIWLESSPSLLDGPGPGVADGGFLDVVRDITAQVEQEEALTRATAAAEAAAVAKSEFLANMSHEIRTPLTAVIGFSSLLEDHPDLSEDARDHVRRVVSGGRSLLAVVNDILDFSKLEAGQYECAPAPGSAVEVARDALMLIAHQARAKGLSMDFLAEGVPETVEIDAARLSQVLLNLLSNAVKFTDAGGVTLALRHEAGQLHVRVDDTGPGVGSTEQARLFQRFSQVDGTSTRRHGGAGLGLAICKGLIEAMGGRIGVTSTPGAGSSFHFHIPAPLAVRPAGAAVEATDLAHVAGLRVLVVDDNLINRELVRVILGSLGAEVSEAGDGPAGVASALAAPFDLILMDIRMPGMNGFEAMELIRRQAGPNRDTRILAFSADAELHHLLPRESGFDGVVHKPLVAATLVEAVACAAPRADRRVAVG